MKFKLLKFANFLPRNIVWYSESFIHISGRKQKLSLYIQPNTRYYHNCYTENANKTNCVELIWKDEYPPNSPDLNPLEYHVWDEMLDMYQCYTSKPTNTYGGEERCASDLSRLVSRPKLIQQYCKRLQPWKKQLMDISNLLSKLMLLATTYHVFFYNN